MTSLCSGRTAVPACTCLVLAQMGALSQFVHLSNQGLDEIPEQALKQGASLKELVLSNNNIEVRAWAVLRSAGPRHTELRPSPPEPAKGKQATSWAAHSQGSQGGKDQGSYTARATSFTTRCLLCACAVLADYPSQHQQPEGPPGPATGQQQPHVHPTRDRPACEPAHAQSTRQLH